jgi:hypothetical protein
MPEMSARRDNFKKGVFAEMKTRIASMVVAVVMMFVCLAFIVAAPLQATAQNGTKYPGDETVTYGKTMIFDSSKQMMSVAKMMREAMQKMREGKDPARARQIMTHGERTMTDSEETPDKAQEMAEKNSEGKGRMRRVTERHNQMIHGSKIMRYGMMRAEAMLTEGPNHLAQDTKKVTAGLETEKSH